MVLKLFKGDVEIKPGETILNGSKRERIFLDVLNPGAIRVKFPAGHTDTPSIHSYSDYEIRDVSENDLAKVIDVLKDMSPDTVAYVEDNIGYTVGDLLKKLAPEPEPVIEVLTVSGLIQVLMTFDPNLPVVGLHPHEHVQQLTTDDVELVPCGDFLTFRPDSESHIEVSKQYVKIIPR